MNGLSVLMIMTTRTCVQNLVGSRVWIHKDFMATLEEKIYMDELTGYALINAKTGRQGLITDFMDIPGNPVFEVSLEGEIIMVPAQDDLIEEIDPRKQKTDHAPARGDYVKTFMVLQHPENQIVFGLITLH